MAAVVGTLLSLLVFFALFGIFLTEYLPTWMTDNELAFVGQADTALLQFKSNIDAQSALGGPTVEATSFPLSSQGVPLLAQPTQATLILLPSSCPNGLTTPTGKTYEFPVNSTTCVFQTVAFSAAAGTATSLPFNQSTSTSVLEMELPNRYFTPQTFYYENDAVIQTQAGSHTQIVGPPPFAISKTARNTTISTAFVGLYGNSTVVSGQGSEEVYSQLVTSDRVTSNGLFLAANKTAVPFVFTFEIGTRNLCAWYTYVSQLVSSSGVTSSAYALKWYQGSTKTWLTTTPSSTVCTDDQGYTHILWLKMTGVSYATVVVSSINVHMGTGVL